MNYRKVNNIVGWITGAIASFVFLKTMEPTASFWDCGEFLSCAYKLEVGHSPGAPFFMLLQRLFGIFAPSPDKAALFINSLSALMSGMTILFLFWTITHFAKKLIAPDTDQPNNNQLLLIIGAGLVGGLGYTFSDTFWFSAVEAEVYASSSFFTAITFWAILKWEHVADNKYADRWLIFISYLIGISVCVHLLNLLTIPALVMVYYYKRYETTRIGAVLAFLAGCAILALVQFGIMQYIPIFASDFDVLFTNSFGLPIDTGAITFVVLVLAALTWLLFFARKRGNYVLHTAVLCILFVIIGYSSYLVAIIRSRADVPIDMTNPDNVISFVSYVDREQFGQQPLLFGPDFNTQPTEIRSKGPVYTVSKKDGKTFYEVVGKKLEPVYDASTERFFPRIWDNNESNHINFYKSYLGLTNGESPTSSDNFNYFFHYQMDWMWWRYFMWNYAGRENDVEGQGEPKSGNWISGIKLLDQHRVGDLDLINSGLKNNGAHNQLYFLPLILGLLGLVFQFNRNKKDGIVITFLFFFTGAAIGIYLNMPPEQPRERDYAFVGCTYAFAIWIGLGVLMVHQWFKKVIKADNMAIVITIILCLVLVPALMAKEEWFDHDRSNKTLPRAVAYNTLMSCAPNAILFTAGDNQTYPLWYLQEVEGVRKDIRIINTSLLGIAWCVDQLNYRINDADAIPMIWKREGYIGDRSNYVRYYDNPQMQGAKNKYFNLAEICKFITSDDPANKLQTSAGDAENYMPSKNFFVQGLSKSALVAKGFLKAEDTASVSNEIKFSYPKDVAYKSDLSILNIVAADAEGGWNRPIYFNAGLPADNYAGLADYMRLEGILYRLVPFKTVDSLKEGQGSIDINKSLSLFMNTYTYGGGERNDVYFDEPNRREFLIYRMEASYLAEALTQRGRKDEAMKLLDKVVAGITEHSYGYDYTGYLLATAYYRIDTRESKEKARNLAMKIVKNADDDFSWFATLSDDQKGGATGQDINQQWQIISSLGGIAMQVKDSATANQINNRMKIAYPKVSSVLNMQRGQGGQ